MTIRKATLKDTPEMGKVMVNTWLRAHQDQVAPEAFLKRQQTWTPEVSAKSWARAIEDISAEPTAKDCLFVAENEEGVIIGLTMAGPSGLAAYKGWGEVYVLYVDFAYQGQGQGRQLLKAAGQHLLQANMSQLIIRALATNTSARHFYEAQGGHLVGEVETEDEGIPQIEVIYSWPDITVLTR
ncbi:MAG: GNAT family N-acetyltransferase [Chloroflexota bacterium]